MLTHVVKFSTEISGSRYEFLINNGSTSTDSKKALLIFIGEIEKLESEQKQREEIPEEVPIEPVHEGA